jgi:hypothetical protein
MEELEQVVEHAIAFATLHHRRRTSAADIFGIAQDLVIAPGFGAVCEWAVSSPAYFGVAASCVAMLGELEGHRAARAEPLQRAERTVEPQRAESAEANTTRAIATPHEKCLPMAIPSRYQRAGLCRARGIGVFFRHVAWIRSYIRVVAAMTALRT